MDKYTKLQPDEQDIQKDDGQEQVVVEEEGETTECTEEVKSAQNIELLN